MQRLIESLSIYSKARQTQQSFYEINLQQNLAEIFADLQDEIIEKKAIVSANNLPVIYAIPILLQQLFVNLIRNALKFCRKDLNPIIKIFGDMKPVVHTENPQHLFYKVTIQDNGIGFEPEMKECRRQPLFCSLLS